MFFWNSLAFLMIHQTLAVWSSAFSKTSFNICKFTIHVLLEPGLQNFEHYFTSVWDECNFAVVWAIFGIAFLWDCNEDWPLCVKGEQYNYLAYIIHEMSTTSLLKSIFSCRYTVKEMEKLFFLWWELLGLVLLTAFIYNIELYIL